MNNNRFTFFKKTLAIPREELTNIKDFYKLGKKCISAGVEGDDVLDDIFISSLPEVNPEKIEPVTFMKSANHALIMTNPGTGKTVKAFTVTGEPTISDCSSANLLGFATADSKIPGKLNGRCKSLYIDEIQEFKEDEVLGKMHVYMEQGSTDIAKGVGIKCRGHATIIYQGNPKIQKDENSNIFTLLMANSFRSFLMKISSNARPFSRRIGEVIVGTNFKTIKGSGVSEENMKRGQQILRTIAEGFRDEFTDLIKNKEINEWLNEEYGKEYQKQINSLIEKCPDNLIKEFFEGQKLNFRHSRGGALRRAWLQIGINICLNEGLKKESIEEIIKNAELHFQHIQIRNLKSYANILDLVNSDVYKQIQEMNLLSLKPEYAKIMFFTLFEYCLDKNEEIIYLNSIERVYNNVKESLLDLGETSKYEFFSRVRDSFEQKIGHLNFFLDEYGLSYDKSTHAFIIVDKGKLKSIIEIYKKIKVQRVQEVQDVRKVQSVQ